MLNLWLRWGIGSCLIVFLSVGQGWANEKPASIEKLTQTQIAAQLENLPGWRIKDGELRRTYEFKTFVEAVNFINRLVEPAETAQHHPDLLVSYNRVTVSLTTHDAGGLTQKDFDLARIIARLFLQTESN